MNRKPPASQVSAAAGVPDIPGRIAWSYLGAVLAVVAGGLVALIAYQVVRPLACVVPSGSSDDVVDLALTCELLWAVGLAMAGFAAAYAGALALLKVEDWWCVWLGVGAGLLGLLLGLEYALDWWWWVTLLLLPAAAALASARWTARPWVRRPQLAGVGLVFAILVTLVIRWLVRG